LLKTKRKVKGRDHSKPNVTHTLYHNNYKLPGPVVNRMKEGNPLARFKALSSKKLPL